MPVIRRAERGDLEAVAAIQSTSPEAAHWAVAEYMQYEFTVSILDGAVAGFMVWRPLVEGECELLNLAVEPANRRHGGASALLSALEREATGELFLEVAESNLPAIALYEHHGWAKTGTRIGYYHSGKINGIVMQKRP